MKNISYSVTPIELDLGVDAVVTALALRMGLNPAPALGRRNLSKAQKG